MKWDDDLLLETGRTDWRLRGQYQLAMYALHLSCGHSIYCKRIKAATIEQYVLAAATFLVLFNGYDCRKDDVSHKHMGHVLGPVYRDLKKFEALPDRKEPYSPPMHTMARKLATRFPPDSLVAALTDLNELGYCGGFRLSECAQPARRSDITKPQLNHDTEATIRTRAFVPSDFRAQTVDRRRIRGMDILLYPIAQIVAVWAIWRTQKNGRNGEEKMFAKNPTLGGHCFPTTLYRALQRFQRLRAIDPRIHPDVTPLTIYWCPRHRSVRLINAGDIEKYIRRLAGAVYHLHPVQDAAQLQRWSSRSLRVGACVTLHALGFSPVDIQWILRWQSTAFMVYLRNVAVLSIRQAQALDRAAALPFI